MFVFDTSGSMGGVLNTAEQEISTVITTVSAKFPNVAFGVANVEDFPHYFDGVLNEELTEKEYEEDREKPWQLDQPVTTEKEKVLTAIGELSGGKVSHYGGDLPESYGRALWETDTNPLVAWRSGARHEIILIADNVPHTADVNEGVPPEFQFTQEETDYFPTWPNTGEEQPGKWGIPGTVWEPGDNTQFQSDLRQLSLDGKPLGMVDYHDTSGDYFHYWEHWAGETGGQAIETEEGGEENELSEKLVTQIETGINTELPACPAGEERNTNEECVVRPNVPANTAAPTILGAPVAGSVLTANVGSWTNAPTLYSYQWQSCTNTSPVGGCTNVGGDSGTYTPGGGDLGKYVRVAVTASNSAGAGSAAYTSFTAQVTEGSGHLPPFAPNPNGFSFENGKYSDETYGKIVNLTPASMTKLFGASVCWVGLPGRGCELKEAAQEWMETIIEKDKGHCYGLAVLSLLLYRGDWGLFPNLTSHPDDVYYGFNAGNVALQEDIAYAHVMQYLPSVRNSRIGEISPIVNNLTAYLPYNGFPSAMTEPYSSSPETYVFEIFDSEGEGHAVTPYFTQQVGPTEYHVYVYDNNWPGDPSRYITLNTFGNGTWSYEFEKGVVWSGGPGTIYLAPVGPGLGTQPWPLNSKKTSVSLTAATNESPNLVITDSSGQKQGYVEGKLVQQIPGGEVVPVIESLGTNHSSEPIQNIPTGLSFTAQINGNSLASPNTSQFSLIGPSYFTRISGLSINPKSTDLIKSNGNGNEISLTTSPHQSTSSPKLTIGVENPANEYNFTIPLPHTPSGATISAHFNSNKLQLGIKGIKGIHTYTVTIQRKTKTGAATETTKVHVRPGHPTSIPAGVWCTVPNLRGKTLVEAKKILKKSHCKLGRITKTQKRKAKTVVMNQQPVYQKLLPAGGKVNIRLS